MTATLFWNELGAFQCEIDRILGGLYRPARRFAESAPTAQFGQDDDHVYVEVAAPGVDPASLEVAVEDGILRVSGERNGLPKGAEVVGWRLNERSQGKFSSQFRLPRDIDRDRVEADYRNGVLLVTLPKAAAAKPKQIEVKMG